MKREREKDEAKREKDEAKEHSAHLLPSGEEEYGRLYKEITLTPKKKRYYALLRCLIVPVRHLL